jgi:hypothetical protein
MLGHVEGRRGDYYVRLCGYWDDDCDAQHVSTSGIPIESTSIFLATIDLSFTNHLVPDLIRTTERGLYPLFLIAKAGVPQVHTALV